MKRLLFLLLWPASLMAAEFGYHPTTPGTLLLGGDLSGLTVASTGETTAGLKYTASAGDVLDSIYLFADSGEDASESLQVALYVVTANQADTRAFIDTVTGITVGSGAWRGTSCSFSFSAGVVYCLALAQTSTPNMNTYYDAGGTEDVEYKSGNMPATWGAAGTDQAYKVGIYAVYHNTGGGGSTPLVIGGNTAVGGNTALGGK